MGVPYQQVIEQIVTGVAWWSSGFAAGVVVGVTALRRWRRG